jgi:3-oxoacyl-[acyl-carrier-protein] synthase II
MQIGAVGVASTVTAGHAAGAQSICYSYDLARFDQADAVFALATDTLTDTVIAAYRALGLLAEAEPGSSGAHGFALAEGCVALLLERRSKAQERGARSYGEVLGYGITSDGRGAGKIDPDGHGIESAMRIALERAGLTAGEIGRIWTSASGLEVADEAERQAVARLFGDEIETVAPKLLLGEPMGVGPSLCAALALQSWQTGDADRRPVLVNGLSLGGTNFSLVLSPHEE